jgi:hypothetical protein
MIASSTITFPLPSSSRTIPLRAFGDNLALSRSGWLGMCDELADGSETLARIRSRLVTDYAEELRESTGVPWELCCQRAELLRDSRPSLFGF